MSTFSKAAAGVAVMSALALTAACGSGTAASSGSTGNAASPSTEASTGGEGMSDSSPPAADLVGPGCAAYAKKVPDGAGSVSGMAQDPVATAAGNNPLLTTLTASVSGGLNPKVNLVNTLNNGEFTVFAPVDTAFAALPAGTVASLKKPANAAQLTKILTYHVVPGRLSPDQVAGTHKTAEGATLKVTGSGDSLKVNGAAVICGGVPTANATVYLIDTVLQPSAM